ncbi:MAG TPA: DsbA family protein, partial [Bauldia sp.]|nr:DsbA family protein [Bauldia sp.]
ELEKRQAAAEADRSKAALAQHRERVFNSPHQVVLGNPKGDVTLVEFFDYNCGYCKRAHADMLQLLDEDKDLRIVLKEFPVLGEGSVQAAQVSIAVRLVAPEKSAEFFNALLDEKGQINGAKALALAEELGIDRAKLDEAMKTDEVKATIEESYDLANKLSLTGTPSYVTAQEVVVGAVGYDALKEKIATARAACATTSC